MLLVIGASGAPVTVHAARQGDALEATSPRQACSVCTRVHKPPAGGEPSGIEHGGPVGRLAAWAMIQLTGYRLTRLTREMR